jgi:hypothetical protein
MGIGFVLVFWALILGVLAIPFSIALGLWSWWNHRSAAGPARVLKILAAAALPFLLLGYGGAAFGVYAIWCEAIRNVDAGIGDSWRVPVGNDHYFCMIDVPDHGYLLKGGCTGSPIVDGITELGVAGDLVFGKSESSGPFMLDTRSGALQNVASMDAALARVTPRPTLRTADEFYNDHRWGQADLIAAVLIAVPAVAVAMAWYFWFIRARRKRNPTVVVS